MSEGGSAEAAFGALDGVLTRWTMGGAAAPAAPPAWRDAIGADPVEAELRLLALSAQFLGGFVVPEPAGEARPIPDLPKLTLAPIPESLRPLARRLLQAMRDNADRRDFLALLAARGRSVHPGDWLPGPNDTNVPEAYAPWLDWAAAAGGGQAATRDALTADNWGSFGPAARRAALAGLRARDPAGARALIESRFGQEAADGRFDLLGVLEQGLSEDDRAFLETLSGDRAPRVVALAARLLARLGHGADDAAEAQELAAFFAVETRGLLRRRRAIVARGLKTPAQRARRTELFGSVDVLAFARALGLSPEELVASWVWAEDREADYGVTGMIAQSGSDGLAAAAASSLTAGETLHLHGVLALLPRLAAASRAEIARSVISAKGGDFRLARTIAGGGAEIDDPINSQAGDDLFTALKSGGETAKANDQADALTCLGLIASRSGAERALERLARAGLLAADPRLDMLRLNASLDLKEARP